MSGNKNLLILIFTIPLLIFVGILFFNSNKAPITPPNALHQGQGQTQGKTQVNSTGNYNFTANEVPTFNFPSVAYASDLQKNVSIYNANGKKIEADITAKINGNGTSVQVNKSQQFMPGKYSLIINQDGKKIEQDFTWGVLAINPNKSIYAPGEVAKLALAVLDEKGNMVCDAQVTLNIKDPSGQTTTLSAQNGTIIVNPECSQKKYTVNPDYETKYQVGSSGIYQMSLTAVTKNGTYNIVDFFTVEENAAFDVERTTGTRIFPYSHYPVSIKIIAKKDFTGQIRELAPASLTMTPLENTVSYNSIEKNTEIQYLVWDVSLKKGESINIGYNFKAPLISPQFYLLGPLHLVSGNTSVFEEKRAWQLAIDSIEYSQTILNTSGLLSYWRLGEASGTVASDEMGNLDLDYINTPTLGATGLVAGDSNTAVTFSRASTEYAKSTAAGMPAGSASGVTLEAWVNFTTLVTGEYQELISWGYVSSTVNYAYLQFVRSSSTYPNQIYYGWSDGTAYRSVYYAPSGGFGVGTGEAHHFVVVHNYTAETVTFYLDGALLNTADVSAYATPVAIPANQAVALAMYTGHTLYGLNGKLDESAIYNVPLSAETVLEHYNTGVALNANLSCDYPNTILADAPVAYWRLGEASGTVAYNTGGMSALNGTYVNTPTLGVTGALIGNSDTAVTFAGASNEYVTVVDNAAIDLDNGPLSYELWVKLTTTGFQHHLIQKGTRTPQLHISGNGQINWASYAYSGSVRSSVFITDTTTWHHIVGTKDTSNNWLLYLDGVDVTYILYTGVITVNTNDVLRLGTSIDPLGNSLRGTLDEVAVYNTVLSPETVLDHYNAGMATSCGRGNFRFEGLQMNGIKIN